MATLDDLRNSEANVKAALGTLGDQMQAKLDALQQKIDQGAPPQDFGPDVQSMQDLIDKISEIAQEQGRSTVPTPDPRTP